jgi:hypothetical protein
MSIRVQKHLLSTRLGIAREVVLHGMEGPLAKRIPPAVFSACQKVVEAALEAEVVILHWVEEEPKE